MSPAGMEPLSEAELDQLAERLGRIQNENALSLEGVDGLFCALIASPVHVPPSAYLPVVLGGELGNGEFFRDFAPEDWDALFESEEEGDLFVIPLVVGEVDAEWPKEPLTTELQDDVVTALAVGFARSYRHFADARRENADAVYDDDLEGEDLDDEYYPDTYVRPAPNVGRNDPCPCGSGKKYKKCCGVADDLAH